MGIKPLADLLKSHNKGVKDVRLDEGIVCVDVSSKRAAFNVEMDLRRTRLFRSVVRTDNNIRGGFVVNAVFATGAA